MDIKLSDAAPRMTFTKFIHKLREERKEVEHEINQMCDYYVQERNHDDEITQKLLSEVLDVMQTCHTFIRSNFTMDEITDANTVHLNKMGVRHGKN